MYSNRQVTLSSFAFSSCIFPVKHDRKRWYSSLRKSFPWRIVIVVLSAVFLATPRSVRGQAAPPQSASPHAVQLSVVVDDSQAQPVADRHAEKIAANRGAYDFGRPNALDAVVIEHTFLLRNDGDTPLTLQRLQSSCGCTTALAEPVSEETTLPLEGKEALTLQSLAHRRSELAQQDLTAKSQAAPGQPPRVPLARQTNLPTLLPGQQVAVRVEVNTAQLASGNVRKSVLVFVRGYSRPLAVMDMTGTLQAPVEFSPRRLDFGRVAARQPKSLTLTATVDPRLAPRGILPPLACSNPGVRLSPLPGEVPRTTPAGPPMLVRRYRVTLAPDLPLGALLGSVLFAAAPSDSPLLRSASVLVSGQAVGDVTASPQAVAFGAVAAGQAATEQLVLSGKAGTLDGVMITPANSWLSARLLPAGPTATTAKGGPAPAPDRVLEVTLRADAPPGVLQSQLMLTLANGQRLLLPVSAALGAKK